MMKLILLLALAALNFTNNVTGEESTTTNEGLGNIENVLNGFIGSLFQSPNGTQADIRAMLGGLLSSGGFSNAMMSDLLPLLGGLGGNTTDVGDILGLVVSNPALASTALNALSGVQISGQCLSDVTKMVQGVMSNELWALYMLDAFGKPESMLLQGNKGWLGSYSECIGVRKGAKQEDQKISAVNGQYCVLAIGLEGIVPDALVAAGLTGVAIGSCLPDTCSKQDVINVVVAAQVLLNVSEPLHPDALCQTDKEIRGDAIAVTLVLAVFALLIFLGTLYDVIAVQLHRGKQEQQTTVKDDKERGPTANTNGHSNSYANGAYIITSEEKVEAPLDTSHVSVKVKETKKEDNKFEAPRQSEHSTIAKLLLSFSVYSNGVKILSPKQSGSLGALNGIRVLSMAWVILGHTYYFAVITQLTTNGSKDFFTNYMEYWTFTAVGNATFSVDSFFALSGTLVAYFTLQELKKARGVTGFNWVMFYVHRYWRLTPMYMLIIMVGTVILPYVIHGPAVPEGYDFLSMGVCRDNWWTNLLYVNNYVNTDKMCMGWSWYLANDMQFYIISPLLLIPLFYNTAAGLVTCFIFIAASMAARAVITVDHRYPAQQMLSQQLPPKDGDSGKYMYMPSYSRIGPYVIGIITGYILYKCKCQCRIPKFINLGCWLLAFCSSSAIIYGVYSHYDSHYFTETESAIYQAMGRTGWGVVVCWVIFSCATGHGGWINEVLSWKPFVPLARLTYAAYLIHPLVMLVFYYSRDQMTYFSNYEVTYLFLGHFVLAYAGGFLVSLVFEAPMMGIEKALLKRGR